MLTRRWLLMTAAAIAVAGPLTGAPRPAPAQGQIEGATALVQRFADEGVVLLQSKDASRQAQVDHFRRLLDSYFAVDAITVFVVGRSWRDATPEQKTQLRALFEDLIVYGYVKRFSEYSGEKLDILRALPVGDTAVSVYSQITRAVGEPIDVQWRVGVKGSTYLITDVIVQNASLSQTWRSDFQATLQQKGGSIDGLIVALRERVAALKADLGLAP
jgi:phospholipid transport system substrate-binding protein